MFTNWVRIIKIIYINLKYKSTWKKRYHKKSSTKKKKKIEVITQNHCCALSGSFSFLC